MNTWRFYIKNPKNDGLEPLRNVASQWCLLPGALGLMRFVRGTSLPVIFPQVVNHPHLLEFHWNPPWLRVADFSWDFLGQNWGFGGRSPSQHSSQCPLGNVRPVTRHAGFLRARVDVHQCFFFRKFIHGCEITTFSSLGGIVTMSFFRERNSWSCFMGKAWQSFPSGFESPNWLHELSATLPLNFLSSKVHYIPRRLTARPWKMVLGRRSILSFWYVLVTFQGRAVG